MSKEQKERNDRLSNAVDPITVPKPSASEGDHVGNFGSRAVPVEPVITREAESNVPITGGAFEGDDAGRVVEAVVAGTAREEAVDDEGPSQRRAAVAPKTTRGISTHPGKPNMGAAPGEPVCY